MRASSGSLPPVWSTGDVGSFAWDTVKRRVPEILAGTRRRLGPVPPEVDAALDELDGELRAGPLRGLREQTPDRPAWDAAVGPHLGRSWLQIPWYFAEAYFYRRVLEATGYFGRGPLAGRDPYASHKAEEWVLGLGARKHSYQPGTTFRVYLDPAGHPFCLVFDT